MSFSKQITEKIKLKVNQTSTQWSDLFLLVFGIAQIYVLMEWVFFVTKRSFLDVFSLPDKIKILFMSGSLVAGASLLILGVIYLFSKFFQSGHSQKMFIWLASLVPAGILSALLLLMVDNFTYTVFSFGIATSQGVGRAFYGLLFLLVIGWSDWQILGATTSIHRWLASYRSRLVMWMTIGAWLVIGLGLVITGEKSSNAAFGFNVKDVIPSSRPHIIWITADGVSATHLSLYGYERDTTPNLRALAESSLVMENMFSNDKHTLGSLTSMYTGKPSVETRVMYSPDILLGEDSYQHLPGILRSLGYYSIQYGYQFYVDAYVVNLMDGFDVADGRSLSSSPIQNELRKFTPEGVSYFIFEMGNRIVDRLRHISYIKTMQDPRTTLAGQVPEMGDDQRLADFYRDLDNYQQPTFIHLHYLGTHGALFEPNQQVFSAGRAPTTEGWDRDFYDDAILEFDANVGRIVDALKQHGLWQNTLFIIGSDHAAEFDQRQRIPLLFHFPGGEITGRIKANVQGLDIAPTILDYLGLPKPTWMIGDSILSGDIEGRYIYGSGARTVLGEEMPTGEWVINPDRLVPPFYQLGAVSIVDCQRWYELDLVEMQLNTGEAEGHTAPCPVDKLISDQKAFDLLVSYLKKYRYDVSSLEKLSLESLLSGK